jgi:hypothetical protein
MGILGKGAMCIWHDMMPEYAAEFGHWHSHEHMQERVSIPGYLRGHRLIVIGDGPYCFTLYEVEDLAVMTSEPYLQRLNNPTPWTQRSQSNFRNNCRTLCTVEATFGSGVGTIWLTVQLSPTDENADSFKDWLTGEVLPGLADSAGITGAHMMVGEPPQTAPLTAEQQLRGGPDKTVDWALVIQGYDETALQAARISVLSPNSLEKHGAKPGSETALYQLVHTVSKTDI